MSAGFVQALWRFPVLGMAGETLRSTQIDVRGVAGDRQHYAGGPEGRIGIQDLPELAQWSAAYPFYPDGAIQPLAVERRHDQRQRLGQVGRQIDVDLALEERLTNQAEIEVLQVAQAAVDQLGRARAGAAGVVAPLDQRDGVPARGGVERSVSPAHSQHRKAPQRLDEPSGHRGRER